MSKFHSANLTLSVLRDECTIIQEHEPGQAKLVHLRGVEVELPVNNQNKFNKAEYDGLNGDFSKMPELVFKKINQPGDVITAHSNMAADNGYFIFDEILYIQGNEQRVFGYGIV